MIEGGLGEKITESEREGMEFEDPDEHEEEEEMELPGSYDNNPGRLRIPASGADSSAATATGKRPRYRECMKNHAVGIGGHALDGCCEFLAAGADGTLDALKCAACNCHRNFHRKEEAAAAMYHPTLISPPPQPYYRSPAGYLHVGPPAGGPQRPPPLALPSTSGGGTPQSRPEEMGDDVSNPSPGFGFGGYGSGVGGPGAASKKRFRTKFTVEQKERMMELAEKLGWRIQKHDEEAVQQFCDETGVKRHVLKVWMHNNKHTIGKKP